MATINNAPTASKKIFGEGLTFDDVLLMPAYSDVLPRDVNTTTQSYKNTFVKHTHAQCSNGYRYGSLTWR